MAQYASNAATLSGMYNEDERRRYLGGMLQHAAPAKRGDSDMDVASDGSATPPASVINRAAKKGKGKTSPKDSVIDPALSGEAGTPKSEGKEEDREQIWVQNMRLIEWMRDMIKKRLERGDYVEDGTETNKEEPDTEMTGNEERIKEKTDQEQLYPVLRHVAEDA